MGVPETEYCPGCVVLNYAEVGDSAGGNRITGVKVVDGEDGKRHR